MLRKLEAKLHVLSRRLRRKPVSARMKYEAAGGSWKYDSASPERLNSFDTSSNDLLDYFLTNRGRRMNKWLHYFEIYDRHFARFRNKSPIVLEIGVSGGGSLEMWRWYFGAGATIIGVDVNESCAQLRDEGFAIEIGDQADPAFWERFKQRYPRIDILIDDGGHTMKQQRVTFERMFPHIDVRGVYLCEDLHTSYIENLAAATGAGKPSSNLPRAWSMTSISAGFRKARRKARYLSARQCISIQTWSFSKRLLCERRRCQRPARAAN